jgi:uncharacterized Zn finger protein (UPF0148 family)
LTFHLAPDTATCMVIQAHCEACNGAIEFEDTLQGALSVCPLCEKQVVLLTDEDRRRRQREKQEQLKTEKRAEHEKKAREERARQEEQAKQEQHQRLRAILTPTDFVSWVVGWITIVISSLFLAVKFFSDITPYGSDTINMSLMHYRETGIIIGCAGEVVGALMLIVATTQCSINNQRSYHYRQMDK